MEDFGSGPGGLDRPGVGAAEMIDVLPGQVPYYVQRMGQHYYNTVRKRGLFTESQYSLAVR